MSETENGGPMAHDPRITGHDSTDDLIKQYEVILRSGDTEQRLNVLTDFVFAYVGAVSKRFREIRAKLPVKPWIFNLASSIGLAAIIGAAIWVISSMTRMDARQNESARDRAEIHAECVEARRVMAGLTERLARMDGNLEILMRAKGLTPLPPISGQ
jgi:hypothetical protein